MTEAPYVPVVHRYGCDCEECWVGHSVNAPKPPTKWQKLCAAIAVLLGGK